MPPTSRLEAIASRLEAIASRNKEKRGRKVSFSRFGSALGKTEPVQGLETDQPGTCYPLGGRLAPKLTSTTMPGTHGD